MVYVNDCLFFEPRKSDIEKIVKAIQEGREMDLVVEDSVCGFLFDIDGQESGR